MFDGIERRLIQEGDRADDCGIGNASICPDRELEDDDALHPRSLSRRRLWPESFRNDRSEPEMAPRSERNHSG